MVSWRHTQQLPCLFSSRLSIDSAALALLAEIVYRCKRHAIDEASAAAMCDGEAGEPKQTQLQQAALVDLEHLNHQLTRVMLDLG